MDKQHVKSMCAFFLTLYTRDLTPHLCPYIGDPVLIDRKTISMVKYISMYYLHMYNKFI